MITLPNLVASDANLVGADATAKTTGSPEDFLALLAGALGQTGETGGDKTTLLSQADVDSLRDLKAQGQSLTKWLVQQEATRSSADVRSDVDADITRESDAQTLLSSLATHLKSGLTADRTSASEHDADDGGIKSELSDEELKSLSALMAMLPVTPQVQPTVNASAPTSATDSLNALTQPLNRGHGKDDGFAEVKGAALAPQQSEARALPADSAFVIPAQKAEAESTPSPSAPTATLAPITGQTTAPLAVPASASANVHAQLGTPDWQQNVSQHITLFTRQGQQTAELRLHPESLGQVHITLKVEDNLAQIQMASPHSHVRAALEAALPVLRSQLADNGIQLGQSSISSDGFAGQQQQQSSSHSFASRAEASVADNQDDSDILAVPAALQSAARGDNAVDIFA